MSNQNQTNISRFQAPFQIRKTPLADAQNMKPQSNVRISPIPNRFEGEVPVVIKK